MFCKRNGTDEEKKMKNLFTQTFLKTVNTTIQHGAKDKEETIKWILDSDKN